MLTDAIERIGEKEKPKKIVKVNKDRKSGKAAKPRKSDKFRRA